MNVSTSQTAVLSANTDVSSAQSQSRNLNNTKTSEKSFNEEMQSAVQSNETNDMDDKSVQNNSDKSVKDEKKSKTSEKDLKSENKMANDTDEIISSEILSGELQFTDYKYHNESQAILSQNIQSLINTKDLMTTIGIASTVEYDSINMSDADANFFANLVQNTGLSAKGIINEFGADFIDNSKSVQQSLQVSSVLMEKLSESLKTNKPFRIDFDKDVSIIIRVNKDGSIAANFIPGDKAVEQYLRNNIASLRQRFDEENLSYSELTYSNSKSGQQQRRKKENNDE